MKSGKQRRKELDAKKKARSAKSAAERADAVRPEWYRLRDALAQADFDAAAAMLKNEPRLIHWQNGLGETVLHFLAVENNQPAIEWLHGRR